jgi:primosomal protein N' (replication factor Y)
MVKHANFFANNELHANMIAEIIPLAHLPRLLTYFDYEVPENFEGQIKVGQLVRIPFKGRKISGIVAKLKNQPDEVKTSLKAIIDVPDPAPQLDENYFALLHWMANYYSVSPALLLKIFIPEPPRRTIRFKTKREIKPIAPSVPPSDILKIQENLKKIFSASKNIFLFHYQTLKNKIALFSKSAARILEQGKQILILEPQITDIEALLPYFLHLFPDKIAVLHSNLSKSEYWREWQKIKNGKAHIVFGARSAIFAPLRNLGLILIDNEEARDFKQFDQYPYYDARSAATQLAEITGAKIILASQAPRADTYYKVKNRSCEILIEKNTFISPPPRLIDMNQELLKKNFLSLSEELQQNIEKTLEQNKKVVLLLNRRGAATFVVCRDCGYVFKCPNCQTPYACHEDVCYLPSKFLCHNCNKEEATRLACPNCRGASIKYFGTGTQTVEREVKKIFPQVKIARIDKDIKIQNTKYQIRDTEIFVGTQFFIKNYLSQAQNIGLIGVVSADTLLFRPDFRAGEKTFAWLTSIINHSQQIKSHVLIQTFFLNNFVIQSAAARNYEEFYKKEIEEREKFGYPPFGKLIKLIYGHTNEKKCNFEKTDLLKKLLITFSKDAEILGDEKIKKDKKRFTAEIIIKIKKQVFSKMVEFLKTVPSGWAIDIDPESII